MTRGDVRRRDHCWNSQLMFCFSSNIFISWICGKFSNESTNVMLTSRVLVLVVGVSVMSFFSNLWMKFLLPQCVHTGTDTRSMSTTSGSIHPYSLLTNLFDERFCGPQWCSHWILGISRSTLSLACCDRKRKKVILIMFKNSRVGNIGKYLIRDTWHYQQE